MREGNIIKYEDWKFKLEKRIKTQGYKQTWKASYQLQSSPKQVVIKFTDIYPRDQQQIHQEAQIHALVKDQFIVSPLCSFEEKIEGQLYLVTVCDYFPDHDYSHIIEENYTYQARYLYLLHVAQALKHLHQNNILHRNIKPENIFVKQNKKIAQLGDFGHARRLKSGCTRLTSASGPPLYMAPQMYMKDQYNCPSDVWSLGLIFFEAFKRQRLKNMTKWPQPPCDKSMYHYIKKQIQKIGKINDPRGCVDQTDGILQMEDLKRLIEDMLQFKPQKRPLIHEICQRLSNIVCYLKQRQQIKFKSYIDYQKEGMEPINGATFSICLKAEKERSAVDEDGNSYDFKRKGLPNKQNFKDLRLILYTRQKQPVKLFWQAKTDNLLLQSESGLKMNVNIPSISSQVKIKSFSTNYNFYQYLKAVNKKFKLNGYNISFKVLLDAEIQKGDKISPDTEIMQMVNKNPNIIPFSHLPQAPNAPGYMPFGQGRQPPQPTSSQSTQAQFSVKKESEETSAQKQSELQKVSNSNISHPDNIPEKIPDTDIPEIPEMPEIPDAPNYHENKNRNERIRPVGQALDNMPKMSAFGMGVPGMGFQPQFGRYPQPQEHSEIPQKQSESSKTIDELLLQISKLEARRQGIQFSVLAHKYHCLAKRHEETGLFFKAISCCETALGYLNMHDPPDFEKMAQLYHILGRNYKFSGKLEMAISCYSQAQQIRIKSRLNNFTESFLLSNSFGQVYLALNNIQEATQTFKNLLENIQKIKDPRLNILTASVLVNLANIFSRQGSCQQSVVYLTQALKIQKVINPHSTNVAIIRMGLSKAKIQLNLPKEALEELNFAFMEMKNRRQEENSQYFTLRDTTVEIIAKLLSGKCSQKIFRKAQQILINYLPEQVKLIEYCQNKMTTP